MIIISQIIVHVKKEFIWNVMDGPYCNLWCSIVLYNVRHVSLYSDLQTWPIGPEVI